VSNRPPKNQPTPRRPADKSVAAHTAKRQLDAAQGQRRIHLSQEITGPLPHSAELANYEEILPGSADRIFSEFEAQSKHRRGLEKLTVDGTERRAGYGQFIGAGILLAAIVAGLWCVLAGQPIAGATIITAALGSGALVYIVGGRPVRADD
jgi:uncharacterized membrane protein